MRLPSVAFLRASLKLWRRRHAYRQRRLDAAHRANNARLIDKWHTLLAIAGQKIRLRERQLAGHNKPTGAAHGIDVSNNQGGIDFRAVKAAGYRFAIIKASEGEGYEDPFFITNVSHARAAGLKVGAYHFLRPKPGRSGRDEADDFVRRLRQASLGHGDIRPVVDVEVTDLSPDRTRAYVSSFVAAVKAATGITPLIYTYPAFMAWSDTYGCDLWIANYGVAKPTVPRPWGRYRIWQHSSSAHVPGVQGNCDVNVCPDLARVVA